jgi:hypothetical protein
MAKAQITAADIRRAREIVEAHGPFIGKGGTMPDNIARVVAEALAEGREQGLKLGLQMLSGKASQ